MTGLVSTNVTYHFDNWHVTACQGPGFDEVIFSFISGRIRQQLWKVSDRKNHITSHR